MDKAIYLASDGAKQAMLAMQANSQNLANANTTGFRADLVRFSTYPIKEGQLLTRNYAVADDNGFDVTPGTLAATKRSLDIAIKGSGWIAVKTASGEEAYTRAGDLQLTLNGLLTTADGKSVMGNKGPISIPPNQGMEIAQDGSISILALGSTTGTMDVIDRIKLVNPPKAQITRGTDGLFHPLGDTPFFPADSRVELITGALEGSNVNSVEVLTKLVELSRYYENQVKLMTVVESNENRAASIIQFN